MSSSLSYIIHFLFFFPKKGPRGEKGSPGEAVIETIKTEVSSLTSQSKWACLSTPLLGGARGLKACSQLTGDASTSFLSMWYRASACLYVWWWDSNTSYLFCPPSHLCIQKCFLKETDGIMPMSQRGKLRNGDWWTVPNIRDGHRAVRFQPGLLALVFTQGSSLCNMNTELSIKGEPL